ncbi:hypothetical protein JW887_04115 [Candidatus Dojkabacteria bacterium]|nr:hypothetical protein [Candidatus Dojkabacteria bacterium]
MHKFYFEFEADTSYKLGFQMGCKFSEEFKKTKDSRKQLSGPKREEYEKLLKISTKYYPEYIEEMEGYAKGAGVELFDIWQSSIDDSYFEKCSTAVMDNGNKVLHMEDGNHPTRTELCIVKRKTPQITKLELFYYNTLGGDACGVTSNGLVFTINTLHNTDQQDGIPINIFTRRISDCKNIDEVKHVFDTIHCNSGYNFNLIFFNKNRKSVKAYNVESSATDYVVSEIKTPFIHTNHYLTKLKKFEALKFNHPVNSTASIRRFEFLKNNFEDNLADSKIKKLTNEIYHHKKTDLHYYHTDARCLFDLKKGKVSIFLEREQSKGWVEYDFPEVTI